jgi:hypothetical protein
MIDENSICHDCGINLKTSQRVPEIKPIRSWLECARQEMQELRNKFYSGEA